MAHCFLCIVSSKRWSLFHKLCRQDYHFKLQSQHHFLILCFLIQQMGPHCCKTGVQTQLSLITVWEVYTWSSCFPVWILSICHSDSFFTLLSVLGSQLFKLSYLVPLTSGCWMGVARGEKKYQPSTGGEGSKVDCGLPCLPDGIVSIMGFMPCPWLAAPSAFVSPNLSLLPVYGWWHTAVTVPGTQYCGPLHLPRHWKLSLRYTLKTPQFESRLDSLLGTWRIDFLLSISSLREEPRNTHPNPPADSAIFQSILRSAFLYLSVTSVFFPCRHRTANGCRVMIFISISTR